MKRAKGWMDRLEAIKKPKVERTEKTQTTTYHVDLVDLLPIFSEEVAQAEERGRIQVIEAAQEAADRAGAMNSEIWVGYLNLAKELKGRFGPLPGSNGK